MRGDAETEGLQYGWFTETGGNSCIGQSYMPVEHKLKRQFIVIWIIGYDPLIYRTFLVMCVLPHLKILYYLNEYEHLRRLYHNKIFPKSALCMQAM